MFKNFFTFRIVVEHGPGQDVEAGIHVHKIDMSLFDGIDPREHDCAIGHDAAARLQDELGGYAQGLAAALENGQHCCRQVGGGRRGQVRMILDTKTAAQVDALNLAACGHNGGSDVHHLSRCLGEGGCVQNLRADVAMQAHRLYSFQAHGPLVGLRHLFSRDTELGRAKAGGYLGMGFRRDIRIDPEEDQSIFGEFFSLFVKNGAEIMIKHQLANGEVRDVEVFSTPINLKEKRVLFSIIHDITDRSRLTASARPGSP